MALSEVMEESKRSHFFNHLVTQHVLYLDGKE